MKLQNTNTMNTMEMSHEVLAQTIMRNTTDIDGIRLGSIPVSLLRIDYEYQRPVHSGHVNQITKQFNRKY